MYVGADRANTHTHTGTDQVLGERCAEGVHYVRVLGGSVEQVADGDGAARCHRVQHCGGWRYDRHHQSFVFMSVQTNCKAKR